MADQYLCEKCGRKTAPGGKEVPRFCSHCGGELSVIETPDDDIIPLADEPAIPAPSPKVPLIQSPATIPPPIPVEPPPINVKIPPVVAPVVTPVVPPVAHPVEPPPVAPAPVPIPAKGVTEVSAKAGKETGKETGAASLEFREELVRCPNCGKQNPAAAEVCTNCGYSRSLGRTLTTRVRSTEPEPAVKPAEKVSERGIAAEKEFATHKRRAAMNPLSDPFRIWAALLLCAAFAALVLALPKYPYQPPDIELHGRVFHPPEIRMQDALGYLAAIFLIATPLLTFVVRLLFLMMKNDNPAHLTSLRAAGSLALAQLVAVGFLFFQMTKLHLDPNTAALAFWGAIAVITFLGTWYLQNVRFLAAALVAIFTVVFAGLAVYLFSAFGLAAIKWMNL